MNDFQLSTGANGLWWAGHQALISAMLIGGWSPIDFDRGIWQYIPATSRGAVVTIDAATVAAYVVASLEAGQVMTPPPF